MAAAPQTLNTTVAVEQAATTLFRAAPQEWARFIAALEAHQAYLLSNMVRYTGPGEGLWRQQGIASVYFELTTRLSPNVLRNTP